MRFSLSVAGRRKERHHRYDQDENQRPWFRHTGHHSCERARAVCGVKCNFEKLEIEVVSSGQNAHGPLHVREGDSYRWFGPPAFEGEWCLKKEFSLFDYGLLGGAELAHVKT